MNLPAGINNQWLTTSLFSAIKFNEAQELHHREEFCASNDILSSMLKSNMTLVDFEKVTGIDVLALYGWNIVFQRDNEQLTQFFLQLNEIEFDQFPQLNVIRLWGVLNLGEYQEVLEECSFFVENNYEPIHPLMAEFLFLKSYAESKLGFPDKAAINAETAYSLFRILGNPMGMGWAGNYLGLIYLQLADFRESLKWFHRILPTYIDFDLPLKQSMVNLNIGVTHYKIGDYQASFDHLHISHKLGVEGGWIHRQCFANIALGNVYRLTRAYETSRKHLHTAYNQAQKLQFPREEALALEFLGDVYRDEGLPSEARRYYARALAIGLKIAPEGDIVMEVHRRVGECHFLEGQLGRAMSELNKGLAMARAQGDRFEEAVILRVMSDASLQVGDLKSARSYIDGSVTILREIDARHELAISLMRSADLTLQEMGNGRSPLPRLTQLNEAWNQATSALDLFIRVDVPWWTEKSRAQVGRIARMRAAQERADKHATGKNGKAGAYNPGDVIIHTSGQMRDLLMLCDMFAGSDEPVLITGETGTGKELIARRIHQHSKCHDGNLVTVNVSAIPQTMFEREFFGHVKGSFSGADRDGEGYAARADGGTLFLDEIGDLPLEAQPKLLRLLQDGTYQAIGDPRERHSDIRLVAATNSNLQQLVAEGKFRADLYYRIRTLDLDLPPVRDRHEDVLPLLRHFLSEAANRYVDLAEYFNGPSLAAIEKFDWPGNVREIAMVARRAHVDLMSRGRVEVKIPRDKNSSLVLSGPGFLSFEAVAGDDKPGLTSSDASERSRLLLALDEAGGNRNAAAKALGVGRSTLYRRMFKLGIPTRRS